MRVDEGGLALAAEAARVGWWEQRRSPCGTLFSELALLLMLPLSGRRNSQWDRSPSSARTPPRDGRAARTLI